MTNKINGNDIDKTSKEVNIETFLKFNKEHLLNDNKGEHSLKRYSIGKKENETLSLRQVNRGKSRIHFLNASRLQSSVYTCAVDSFLEMYYFDSIS